MDEARRGEIALFCNGDDYNLIRCIKGGKVVTFIKERTCKRENLEGETFLFKCSECGGLIIDDENYCPICGAKVNKDES